MEGEFDRLGFGEPDVVEIDESLEFWGDIDVASEADDHHSWVDEIGLALGFAGAEVGDEGVALFQADAGAREVESLVDIPAKRAADEEGMIEDGIEAASDVVGGVVVAAGIEAGEFEADPIAIVAEFESGHLGVDGNLLAGEGVEFVTTENLIEGVGEIPAPDVAIARPTEIEGFDVVTWRAAFIGEGIAACGNCSKRFWASEKANFVVTRAPAVEVHVEAGLGGVAFPEKILAVEIGDEDLLVAGIESVEIGIGVLFPHVEKGEIVLEAIVVGVAENAGP